MKSRISKWKRSLRSLILNYLRPGHDTDELLHILQRAVAVRSEDQRDMLEQVVEFGDLRVREVMVPRSAIHAVPADMPLHEVEKVFIHTGVSRLPVMDGDLDHILGVVHIWDVIAARVEGTQASLPSIVRHCLRVPELAQALSILDEMRTESCHIAIVHDEYGGTAGLITLTDLLTELVGSFKEMGDKSDRHEECIRQPDGSYVVLGRMHVEDLAEEIGVTIPEGDYDTIAGLITSRLERIPMDGEQLELDGLAVTILQADPRRILKIRLRVPTETPA